MGQQAVIARTGLDNEREVNKRVLKGLLSKVERMLNWIAARVAEARH
jgi:hypothetical protein